MMEIRWTHGNISEVGHIRQDEEDEEDEDDDENVSGVTQLSSSWLSSVPLVEGVLLRFYPTYAEESLLPPKVA
jgi:hypothetical protein